MKKRDLTELDKLEQYLKTHGFDYVREDWTNKKLSNMCARNIWAHMESLDDIYDHHQIIVMKDHQVIRPAVVDGEVEIIIAPHVPLVPDTVQAFVGKGSHHLTRIVLGSVIQHVKGKIPVCLIQNAFNRLPEIIRPVIGQNINID